MMKIYFCQNMVFLTILLLPFPKKLVLGYQNEQDHSQYSKYFKTNFTG